MKFGFDRENSLLSILQGKIYKAEHSKLCSPVCYLETKQNSDKKQTQDCLLSILQGEIKDEHSKLGSSVVI
jgi:hypothetical protein